MQSAGRHGVAREQAHDGKMNAPRCRKACPGRCYRIREVDGGDDEVADALAELHRLTFFDGAPVPCFDDGHWWLAFHDAVPVAFAGIIPSTHMMRAAYLTRVGVLGGHVGQGLQRRLMRAAERRSHRNGFNWMISDTTDNIRSANNFIHSGYQLYRPDVPWAFAQTLYWRKFIGGANIRW